VTEDRPVRLPAGLPARLGEPLRTRRLRGGNVSHVYRITGSRGSVVLKVRGDRFAAVPELKPEPSATEDEGAVLRLLEILAPGLAPRVLDCRPDLRELVLSDLAPHGEPTLQAVWAARAPSEQDAAALADSLRRLHTATAQVCGDLRRSGDAAFRRHWLGYVLGPRRHPAVQAVRDWVHRNEPPRLVHGDFSPKNVIVTAPGLRICDLDNAHLGSRLVEFGYAAGHVVLHGSTHRSDLPALCRSFVKGYLGGLDELPWPGELVCHAMAGAISYRLDNRLIPYPLAVSEARRADLGRAVDVVLAGRHPSLTTAAAVMQGWTDDQGGTR
jgi:hypothetical protein